MGKYEKGTPKEIANRCKSKGLQKLRWFCQMCQKQCRDQNGFKCHLTSEAHQRQLLLFAENPHNYLKDYSRNFEHNFLRVLRSTFGTKRVRANEVYQEYIRDKMHVHMNSTIWHTLTNFVQYLGSSGKCKIDQTEKGWFIALIDQEEEMRKREAALRVKVDQDDEQRLQEMLQRQAERARELLSEKDECKSQATELMRDLDGEKVIFSLAPKKPTPKELAAHSLSTSALLLQNTIKKEVDEAGTSSSERNVESSFHDRKTVKDVSYDAKGYKRQELKGKVYDQKGPEKQVKKRALEEIMEMEMKKKERKMKKDHWLCEGIVVKIVTKKFGDEFYKTKGIVKTLVDEYTANVDVDGKSLIVDQSHLETVIPCEGRKMLILNGFYSGKRATLKSVNVDEFSLKLVIENGPEKGRVVSVPYEHASKLAT